MRNNLIAQMFYDIGYIEKYGSGTIKIIDLCKRQGIPYPEFKEVFGGFSVIFRKDVYTEEYLRTLGLNERQIKAGMYVKERGKITNKEYQEICNTSERTATRDLSNLVSSGLLEQVGITGKGTGYVLRRHKDAKGLKNRLVKEDHQKDSKQAFPS
ncbi:MAG: ATP-binding protein [Candidatus Omnitrophota bacterium]